MIPRINTVTPTNDYKLIVTFDDGKHVMYDVENDIRTIKNFEALKTMCGLFQQVKLDSSRTVLYWNEHIDLASDSILEYGTPLSDEEFHTLQAG